VEEKEEEEEEEKKRKGRSVLKRSQLNRDHGRHKQVCR
jgi:hypothetical protein